MNNFADLKYSMDGMGVNEKPWVHWNESGFMKTWSNHYFVRIAKLS